MKYIILPRNEVTQEMLDHCLETNFASLRVSSNDNTILKYNSEQPACLSGKAELDAGQIKEELKKAEWGVALS